MLTDLIPTCSQTFLAYLDKKNEKCGYAGYMDQYVKYPPSGLLPLPGGSFEITDECNLWSEIADAALIINPAFNVYRIFDVVRPSNPDVLLDPSEFSPVPHSLGCPWLPVGFHARHCLGPPNDLIQRFIP